MLGIKKTVIEVEYEKLNKLVNKVYPFLKGYNFAVCQESMNDTMHLFKVPDCKNIKDYDMEMFNKRWNVMIFEDYPSFDNELILHKLYFDGHIEAGEYLINVCW